MLVLASTTQVLQIVLAGAVAANQPKTYVSYYDENKEGSESKSANQVATGNSTTDVTILAAPQQNFVRYVEFLSIYNKDTASIDCTLKLDDNATETEIVRQTIPTLRSLCWDRNNGFYIV